CLQRSNWLTF
nr:immunoglobulin light chain junction region [Macaca mulatta]MOV75520.1 immunoglobulin light chain junction region [Macaca mulatta]MOW34559.1 immunoglobulin light chain junction region [Macaca mulatta]MOW34706.1 immunoglobulin light chain junction region [Macaca mulatta]